MLKREVPLPKGANLSSARLSISIQFMIHGTVQGTFASRIPWIQAHLGLSTADLGLALICPAIGASVTMSASSHLIYRYGYRAVIRTFVAGYALLLVLPTLATSLASLCALLFVFGAVGGLADVLINAQGVEVERRIGKSIISSLHGLWSCGMMIGASAGVIAVHLKVQPYVHLALCAATLGLLASVSGRQLGSSAAVSLPTERRPRLFALPSKAVWAIGVVGMCGMFTEGASATWSGVYLQDVLSTSETLAAAGYSVFSLTIATSRLAGDLVVRRFGAVATATASGMMIAAGALLVVVATSPVPCLLGFAVLGLGASVVVPLTFGAAANSAASPSRAIAGVASITYITGLTAPALIGAIGEWSSLRGSFGLVLVGGVLLAWRARALAPQN